jgi:hypothetical protein
MVFEPPVTPNVHLKPRLSTDLAGSTPVFARNVGATLVTSAEMNDFRQQQLIFSQIDRPGRTHVYRADCRAGERLRVQLLTPVLPGGGAVTPAIAVIAQSLPYDAEEVKLPFSLPAGYSAVVASPPKTLLAPVSDALTRVSYYPGPVIDTRTLVGGRCYIAVWSPHNQMGKYALHVGHSWPWSWRYWLGVPRYWWQIRGWFGMSRLAAYVAAGGLLLLTLLVRALLRRTPATRRASDTVINPMGESLGESVRDFVSDSSTLHRGARVDDDTGASAGEPDIESGPT